MTLGRYIRRRLVQAVVTLVVLTLVVHAGITVLPGDPVRALFGFRPPSADVLAELRDRFRLDDPYPVQYAAYLGQLLQGDLGTTIEFRPRPVSTLVGRALGVSSWLILFGIGFQLLFGYVAAVLAAYRDGSILSRFARWSAIAAAAIPVILSAYVLRSVFTVGYRGLGLFPFRFEGGVRSYLLPVAALVAMLFGPVMLLFTSELRQALSAPFSKYARSVGLTRTRVVGVHAARAAAGPVITYVASNLGYLMTGVAVIEAAFGIPGVGGLIISSIGSRDRQTVVGGVLVVAVLVVAANTVADVIAAVIDPRLRYDRDVSM